MRAYTRTRIQLIRKCIAAEKKRGDFIKRTKSLKKYIKICIDCLLFQSTSFISRILCTRSFFRILLTQLIQRNV